MQIIPKDKLEEGIEMLSQLLDTKIDETEGHQIANLLNELSSVLGTAAYYESVSRYYNLLDKKDAKSTALFLYIERLNRNFSHRITALQTILKNEISSQYQQRRT